MREKQKCHEISGRFVGGPERASPSQKGIFFQYGTAHGCQQHLSAHRIKKFFLLHFVWMLHLQQWNREEIKLLNNRVLNIAGTNNRIRQRIKSYPLGFGTFGGSQLLTHSPNKWRSGMSWCWPSEGGSALQPQLPRWFQPIPSWSSVSKGQATSQALRFWQHVRHHQHAREGTGDRRDQRKYTQRETPALFVLVDTFLSELCWGKEQTLRRTDCLTSGGRRFQIMSKESDGPQGLQNRDPRLTPPEPIDQEGIITFLSADGVSAHWTQRFPLQHHGYQLDW